jgi:Holliday junction resolvase RusA-like endonuclease
MERHNRKKENPDHRLHPETVTFTVEGKPKGKARPRFANGHAYTPQATRDKEQEIAWRAKEAGVQCTHNAVTMTVEAFFIKPKSWTAQKKENAAYPTCKPDADNIGKIVGDALNSVAYEDDAQIVSLIVHKYWGDTERMEVTIEEL